MNFRHQIILSIVAYPFILYAVAFVSVWINPYRYDDRTSRRKYIPSAERWTWAMAVLVNYLDASVSLVILFLIVILTVIALSMLWAVVVN